MKIHLGNKDVEISKTYLVLGILFVLTIILLLLKGGSSKNVELTCTNLSSNATGEFKEIYKGIFKNDKLDTLIVEFTNKPTSNDLGEIAIIYDNYESQLASLKKAGGYTYQISKDDKSVYFKSTIKLKEIPDSTKSLIKCDSDCDLSMQDFKKNLEDNKFECK